MLASGPPLITPPAEGHPRGLDCGTNGKDPGPAQGGGRKGLWDPPDPLNPVSPTLTPSPHPHFTASPHTPHIPHPTLHSSDSAALPQPAASLLLRWNNHSSFQEFPFSLALPFGEASGPPDCPSIRELLDSTDCPGAGTRRKKEPLSSGSSTLLCTHAHRLTHVHTELNG